jgi:endoglucanase
MRKHILAALAIAVPSFAIPLVNQLGFAPESEKIVVIPGNDANPLEVRDMAGKVVLTLEAPMVYDWEYSGEEVQTYDISSIKKPGTYRLYRDGYIGNPVVVGEDVYVDVTKAALKWFYFQRAGMALETRYAGKWARAMGHADDSVIVYGTDLPTAKTVAKANGKAEPKKADAKIIKSQRGWYDAGDYGKYIVNSGITVFTLLEMYEHFPQFVDTLHWNIPREFPNMPELLEEIRWNLDWMLSMQDKDGGVYHKLTSLKFGSSTMPELDGALRYAIEKSLTATLDFAAVMAQASRVYAKFDAEFSKKMLKASEVAYYWAKRHPKALYKQPSDVETGNYTYGEENGKDEFAFAATELYRATKKADYLKDMKQYKFRPDGAWWGDVNMLAVYHVALDSADFGAKLGSDARKALLKVANELRAIGDTSAYRLPAVPSSWNWGSNSAMANNGIVLLHAYYLTGDKSYLDGAQQCLDYLLGKNPMEISYVTGFGFRSPRFPHHRVSESDFVDDPVPGMLVGGPHLGKQDINLDGTELWKCPNYATADKPALAYIDNRCSYATNEVAINWNAPLAYLAGALQAIYSGHANAVVK